MKKEFILPILALTLFSVSLSGCRKEGGKKPTPPTPPVVEFTITLDKSNLSLKEGEQSQLVATTSEPATVTWSTSSEEFATVTQEGLVYAVKEGNATITASANNKSATCLVTITKEVVPPGPGEFTITLDYNRLQLKVGEHQQITATTSEPATVSWTSSKENVASVVDGYVTALEEGTTTITASANGESATCEVEVKPVTPPTPVDTPVTLAWGTKTLVDIDDLQNGEEKGPYVVGLLATQSSSELFSGSFSVSLTSVETGAYKIIDYLYVNVYESATKEGKVLEINDTTEKYAEAVVSVSGNEEKKLYFFIGIKQVPAYIFSEFEGYVSLEVDWS